MECVFCKIVKGEIPSLKVYEDQEVIAILDINPANYGHTLVIPKSHHEDVFSIPRELFERAMGVAKEIAERMKSSLSAEGVNIIHSSGQAAGQVIPHLIVHVIPRFEGDKVVITYERVQPEPDKMKETLQKLMSPPSSQPIQPPQPSLPPEEKFSI